MSKTGESRRALTPWLVALREDGNELAEDELEDHPHDIEGYLESPTYTCHGCGRLLNLSTDLVTR